MMARTLPQESVMEVPPLRRDPGPVEIPEPPRPQPPEPWEPAKIPRSPEPPQPPGRRVAAARDLRASPCQADPAAAFRAADAESRVGRAGAGRPVAGDRHVGLRALRAPPVARRIPQFRHAARRHG